MNTASRNGWVGRVLVEELARQATPLVCLAPGGRCAPLSLALGSPRCSVPWTTFVDERAAAFHALGVARATGRPAVVITTSGTAVGNLVPAAMEADRAGVPLLLLTADRPAERRQTGANQTVQQADLLAPLVRFRADLGCSDEGLGLTALLSTLAHAVQVACTQRGPVHLNLQFREPLGPAEGPVPAALAAWWRDPSRRAWTPRPTRFQGPSPALHARAGAWHRTARGLVVVGSLPAGAAAPVQALVRSLGWPTHCTAGSGVAGGMRGLDSALADDALGQRLAPETVLWIGGSVVSKRVVQWLEALADRVQVISLTDHTERIDPAFRVRERHIVDYAALETLVQDESAPAEDWLADWHQLDAAAEAAVVLAQGRWSELSAARAVVGAARSLFLGASLPIRLVDWMGTAGRSVRLSANRGASGIDGVLATAAGWARHAEGPCKVLLGDLTCLHDQGSLPLVREVGLQAVVLNNLGGSIFGLLPFGQSPGFDRVFRNAHTRSLVPLAEAHGLRARSVASQAALLKALADPEIDFVEARFEHQDTVDAVASLHGETRAALRRALGLP